MAMPCFLKKMKFKISSTEGFARKGELKFDRGSIQTPAFMPVGTNGTVKALEVDNILETGTEIILGNTYHLMLRPGDELIKNLGGLHKFSNWNKPILTDSGGFQVWSLGDLAKITEEGIRFQSPYDGTKHFMSPEDSMRIQNNLGSDIVMVLDECTPYPSTHQEARKSMELSMRWAKRSMDAHQSESALFGIVQGGMHEDLRLESLSGLNNMGFAGIAIGGLSVGEPKEDKTRLLKHLAPHLPAKKPHYLMGVGKPEDIVEAVFYGIDMFDCVLPTRNARNGQLITSNGVLNIRNAPSKANDDPIDRECNCKVCRGYSQGYLNHLDKTNEMLGSILNSFHNIYYYQSLMSDIRESIASDSFAKFIKDFYNKRHLEVPKHLI
jgi:queuine tRNA-ribosyltransferase